MSPHALSSVPVAACDRVSATVHVLRLNPPGSPQGVLGVRHLFDTELGSQLATDGIGVEVLRLQRPGGLGREIEVLRAAWLSRSAADIVVASHGAGIRLALLRELRMNIPKILSIEYDPLPAASVPGRWRLGAIGGWLRRLLLRRIDCVVMVSEDQAASVRRRLGDRPRIVVVPNSVDRAVFHRENPPAECGLFMVHGAGRDYDVLADALAQIQFHPPRLVIAHRDALSSAAESAIARIRHAGYAVELLSGATGEQLRHLYEECSAVVIPTLPSSQAFGMTAFMEAVAMGCAVVATEGYKSDLSGLASELALLVPPLDAGALALALRTIDGDRRVREDLRGRAAAMCGRLDFSVSLAALRQIVFELAEVVT